MQTKQSSYKHKDTFEDLFTGYWIGSFHKGFKQSFIYISFFFTILL